MKRISEIVKNRHVVEAIGLMAPRTDQPEIHALLTIHEHMKDDKNDDTVQLLTGVRTVRE